MTRTLCVSLTLFVLCGCVEDTSRAPGCYPEGDDFEVSTGLRTLDRVEFAGLACTPTGDRELRLSLQNRDGQSMTPDSGGDCVLYVDLIDGNGVPLEADSQSSCPGPLSRSHPRYQEFFDALCAGSGPDLSQVTVFASTPTLEPVHERDLVLCGHPCGSDSDCADLPQGPVSYTHLTLPTICSV